MEKPAKKQKGGESSKPSGSAKSNDNAGDNMFQVKQCLCSGVIYHAGSGKAISMVVGGGIVPCRSFPVHL